MMYAAEIPINMKKSAMAWSFVICAALAPGLSIEKGFPTVMIEFNFTFTFFFVYALCNWLANFFVIDVWFFFIFSFRHFAICFQMFRTAFIFIKQSLFSARLQNRLSLSMSFTSKIDCLRSQFIITAKTKSFSFNVRENEINRWITQRPRKELITELTWSQLFENERNFQPISSTLRAGMKICLVDLKRFPLKLRREKKTFSALARESRKTIFAADFYQWALRFFFWTEHVCHCNFTLCLPSKLYFSKAYEVMIFNQFFIITVFLNYPLTLIVFFRC